MAKPSERVITIPRMGTLQLMLEDMFARLDVKYIMPPPSTAKTIEIGVRHSPEFSCLPLKVTLGNFIEAIEAGADTCLMAGGCGPCRFGYYAQVQKEITKDLGYDVDWIVLEPPKKGFISFLRTFKKIAPHLSIRFIWRQALTSFEKARQYDSLEKRLLHNRAYELEVGASEKAYTEAVDILRPAVSKEEIAELAEVALKHMDESVAMDKTKDVLKVGIVGEFFMLLEPMVNFDIEKWLGERGVMVDRAVYTTDWIAPSLANQVGGLSKEEVSKYADKYLSHTVGGDGQQTIAHTVLYVEEGYDGIVHLMPFTCMPETIAKSILPKVSKDLNIPLLTLVVDEQTGKAGFITRLEAMLDMMWARRAAKAGHDDWIPAGAGTH